MAPLDEANQRLQRLLALKRHERPPPGFFERLPNRILVNIRAGTEMEEHPWWSYLFGGILREPMIAGSYAALGIGALLFGVSVFQMAIDPGEPLAGVPLDGMAVPAPGVPMTPIGNLPSGVIYRVTPAALQGLSETLPEPGAPRINALFRTDTAATGLTR
jgi:hypothetical protein